MSWGLWTSSLSYCFWVAVADPQSHHHSLLFLKGSVLPTILLELLVKLNPNDWMYISAESCILVDTLASQGYQILLYEPQIFYSSIRTRGPVS